MHTLDKEQSQRCAVSIYINSKCFVMVLNSLLSSSSVWSPVNLPHCIFFLPLKYWFLIPERSISFLITFSNFLVILPASFEKHSQSFYLLSLWSLSDCSIHSFLFNSWDLLLINTWRHLKMQDFILLHLLKDFLLAGSLNNFKSLRGNLEGA